MPRWKNIKIKIKYKGTPEKGRANPDTAFNWHVDAFFESCVSVTNVDYALQADILPPKGELVTPNSVVFTYLLY